MYRFIGLHVKYVTWLFRRLQQNQSPRQECLRTANSKWQSQKKSRDNIQIFCQNFSISPGGLAYNIRTWTSTKVDIKGEESLLFLIVFDIIVNILGLEKTILPLNVTNLNGFKRFDRD
jgi:hypothetical protein